VSHAMRAASVVGKALPSTRLAAPSVPRMTCVTLRSGPVGRRWGVEGGSHPYTRPMNASASRAARSWTAAAYWSHQCPAGDSGGSSAIGSLERDDASLCGQQALLHSLRRETPRAASTADGLRGRWLRRVPRRARPRPGGDRPAPVACCAGGAYRPAGWRTTRCRPGAASRCARGGFSVQPVDFGGRALTL
jgi:hypothetical protein